MKIEDCKVLQKCYRKSIILIQKKKEMFNKDLGYMNKFIFR